VIEVKREVIDLRENSSIKQNECRPNKNYKLSGKTYNQVYKRRRDRQNYRLRQKPQIHKTLTSLRDNNLEHIILEEGIKIDLKKI
jgi:hypothetical protein